MDQPKRSVVVATCVVLWLFAHIRKLAAAYSRLRPIPEWCGISTTLLTSDLRLLLCLSVFQQNLKRDEKPWALPKVKSLLGVLSDSLCHLWPIRLLKRIGLC